MNLLKQQFLFSLVASCICVVLSKHVTLEKHLCSRPCTSNTTSMTCHYKFEVERYYTMSKACYSCPYNIKDCFNEDCIPADGFERLITVINRQMPGPGIQVCLGDTVIVDVINSMTEESTSIHWHGHHQRQTPYMDGVPFITQCPIAPGTSFRYKFMASLPGTHFYHSHTACQRADGVYGSLIIRQPKSNETHAYLYDHDLREHVMIVTDWLHGTAADKFAYHYHGAGDNKPNTILLNGMGKHEKFKTATGETISTPLAKFNVEQGKRYRFRIINAGSLYCPLEVSIDNHTLIIINSDGGDMEPTLVESLVTYAGERWDFIVNANNNISNYWIKIRGLADCGPRFNSAHTIAVLHYKGAENSTPNSTVTYKDINPTGVQANPLNIASGSEDYVTIVDMTNNARTNDPALKPEADIGLFLPFDFYPVDNSMFHRAGMYGFQDVDKKYRRYIPQINHISMKMPSFPLLSEPQYASNHTFCDTDDLDTCVNETFCFCTYKIDLPLRKVVEIIFVDEGKPYESNHPFHFHGHSFRVVALGKLGNFTTLDAVRKLNDTNQITRNLLNPPIKDTVTVLDGGYTVIRFYTANPGYWLLHCHLDFHVETGMAVLFKIGEHEDFLPIPENFPKCGNYFNQASLNNGGTTSSTKEIVEDDSYVYYTDGNTNNSESKTLLDIWKNIENYFTRSFTPSIHPLSSLIFISLLCFML